MSRAAQPQTIAADLCLRIQNLAARSGRYLERDSFEARMLLRDCERLQQADVFDGTIALLYMAEAYGEVEDARRSARQAAIVRPDLASEAEFQLGQSLVSLGYFSEAQAIYARVGSPELGQMSHRFSLGMVSGSIEQIHEFLGQARAMNIVLSEDAISSGLGAYAVYQNTSTTDRQAGDLLDLAGEVLRAHRLFALNGSPQVSAIDHAELSTLLLELTVKAPIEEIGMMNFELADLVARRLDVVPAGVAVVFSGVRT